MDSQATIGNLTHSSPSSNNLNPSQHQHQQNQQSMIFVVRKSFSYKTKYNLTALIRELEAGMSEICKVTELTTSYFAFTSNTEAGSLGQPLAARLKQMQANNSSGSNAANKKTVTLKQCQDDSLDK